MVNVLVNSLEFLRRDFPHSLAKSIHPWPQIGKRAFGFEEAIDSSAIGSKLIAE